MSKQRPKRLVMLLIAVSFLVGCSMDLEMEHRYSNRIFSNNGERIYFTGSSQSGQLSSVQGQDLHTKMHENACVRCHREHRQGGRRMYPFFWIKSPPITTEALFSHQDRAYTRESLKAAITQGIDVSGEKLGTLMPRWSLNKKDLDDLVDYLSTDTFEYAQTNMKNKRRAIQQENK